MGVMDRLKATAYYRCKMAFFMPTKDFFVFFRVLSYCISIAEAEWLVIYVTEKEGLSFDEPNQRPMQCGVIC